MRGLATMPVAAMPVLVLLLLAFGLPALGNECRETCHPHHGECDVNNTCRCVAGWQGPNCDQCVTRPGCTNGYCVEPWQCFCKDGWTGYFCNSEELPCNSSPCENNSTCSNLKDGEFSCDCLPGFSGKRCQKKEGLCEISGNRCQNGGTCVDFQGHEFFTTCLCAPGYSGDFCETLTVDCHPNPCENGGKCFDLGEDFSCSCPPGYTDKTCSQPINSCVTEPCQNGGTCVSYSHLTYECRCPEGYGGPTCGEKQELIPPVEVTAMVPQDFLDSESTASVSYDVETSSQQHVLKVAVKEQPRPPPTMSQGQAVCFTILGILTTLMVGGGFTLLFMHRCGGLTGRLRARRLFAHRQQRRMSNPLMCAVSREELAVNIIMPPPERIGMTNIPRDGMTIEDEI